MALRKRLEARRWPFDTGVHNRSGQNHSLKASGTPVDAGPLSPPDFGRQTTRAADIHTRYLIESDCYTCSDCHKGIAHELPDMTGIDPGWLPPEEVREEMDIPSTFHHDPDADAPRHHLQESMMRE